MQTALRIDSEMNSASAKSAIRIPVDRPSSPCVSCISKSYCLQKSIDIDKLADPNNQYVQKFKVKKGDSIFNNGDDHQYLFNIRIGHVKIEHSLPNGQHQITQFGMPGDVIGLDGWADGKHHLAAYALNDTELCSINVKQFHKAMDTDHSLLKIIEQLMSSVLNHTQEHLFSLGIHTAEQKLAYFLIEYRNRLSYLHFRIDTIRLSMNRADLSSYLGLTLETLSRSFTFLEKKGYILVKNKDVTFINFEGLEHLLEPKDLR